MERNKYGKALQELSKKSAFTARQGREVGIPSRMLDYFCEKGMIKRFSRGLYIFKDFGIDQGFEWEDLMLTALSIPNGVICLISALCFYDLTDEIMREFWIAVPHSTSSPKRENTRIVRMRNMILGKTSVKIGNHELAIFDHERTVVDAFRYLDLEIAIKALQTYLKMSRNAKPNIKKLMKYAKMLRVNLTPYIMAITT